MRQINRLPQRVQRLVGIVKTHGVFRGNKIPKPLRVADQLPCLT